MTSAHAAEPEAGDAAAQPASAEPGTGELGTGEPAAARTSFRDLSWVAGFRRWRRGRPFWGGLFSFFGGLEILLLPLAPLTVVVHEGIAGVSGVLMGILMIVMALSMWFAPQYRHFAGIATVLFAVASLVLSNFGGFLLGMLLGIFGGALSFAWMPAIPAAQPAEPASASGSAPEGADDGTTVLDTGDPTVPAARHHAEAGTDGGIDTASRPEPGQGAEERQVTPW